MAVAAEKANPSLATAQNQFLENRTTGGYGAPGRLKLADVTTP